MRVAALCVRQHQLQRQRLVDPSLSLAMAWRCSRPSDLAQTVHPLQNLSGLLSICDQVSLCSCHLQQLEQPAVQATLASFPHLMQQTTESQHPVAPPQHAGNQLAHLLGISLSRVPSSDSDSNGLSILGQHLGFPLELNFFGRCIYLSCL